MENLLTRKEAASRLGVSLFTLDLARSTGQISYIQYVENGNVFFTEKALEEYVARSTHRARPEEHLATLRQRRSKSVQGVIARSRKRAEEKK